MLVFWISDALITCGADECAEVVVSSAEAGRANNVLVKRSMEAIAAAAILFQPPNSGLPRLDDFCLIQRNAVKCICVFSPAESYDCLSAGGSETVRHAILRVEVARLSRSSSTDRTTPKYYLPFDLSQPSS